MKGNKLNNSDALKFIFAGNSIVTFVNTKTGNRFTYKTKISHSNPSLFFVSILTNPEKYEYLGLVVEGIYNHGKKSRIKSNAQSSLVFKWVLNKLILNNLPDFIEVWHEGRCGKCGKSLTVPSSILNGLGPDCYKTLSKVEKRDKFLKLILADV